MIGVPVKLLHEAEGHKVTIMLKSGETYYGKMTEAEDNMNCNLVDVKMKTRDGKLVILEQAYIRGSHICFIVVPDMLKNSPMFRRGGAKAYGIGASALGPKPRKKKEVEG